MCEEVSDSKMSVIRMTPYMHTMPLFAIHIKVFFIPGKVFFHDRLPKMLFVSKFYVEFHFLPKHIHLFHEDSGFTKFS